MKNFFSYGVLIVFTIVLNATDCEAQYGTVKGVVRGVEGVLSSATVALGNETVLSNESGEFTFYIRKGKYTLIVSHAGYERIARQIIVWADSTVNFSFILSPVEQLGEVVALGSRSLVHRSNLHTPVPVDAFSSNQLKETGHASLVQMLNFTAPSFNASRQSYYEPVTLRGLDPDETLILLNGTRYPYMAYVHFLNARGVLGRGSVANDLNVIPFSAIEKVEILRDGASAQFGSDALAGVINIELKKTTGKTSIDLQTGQQYEGDGETIWIGINRGASFNKNGILNVSADIQYREPVFRRGEYTGTVYYSIPANSSQQRKDSIIALDNQKISSRNFDRKTVSHAGTAKFTSLGMMVNGSYNATEKTELFWTGGLSYRENIFQSSYTFPKNTRQVNPDLYPDGFKAKVTPHNWNISGIAGARGEIKNEWHWELTSAYGSNINDNYSENTNNPSQYGLGKDAPTSFYTSTLIFQQLTNDIQLTRNKFRQLGKVKSMNLHWGAELRFENFRMKAGEEAAWKNYDDTSFKKQAGVTNGLIVSPADALNRSRAVVGTFVDFEGVFANRLTFDLAGRFEHYTDFGNNLAGKIASIYKLSKSISLRVSASNGFRAPALQQRYLGSVGSGFRIINGVTIPTTGGLFNNDNKVTKVFGVLPLEAEKSINVSTGITGNLSPHLYMTIDAYWIQIKKRIVLSGIFDRVNNQGVDSLLNDSSLRDYSYVDQVRFFSNAINTRTLGVDLVLRGKWNFTKYSFDASLAANFTRTRLFGEIKTVPNLGITTQNLNSLFNNEEQVRVEHGQPENKIILTFNYKRQKFGFLLRNTRFGKTGIHYTGSRPEWFSPKILTDCSISYKPRPWITITPGANNIFDVYPDPLKYFQNTGEGVFIYSMEASPFGFSGGYYYVRMHLNFDW